MKNLVLDAGALIALERRDRRMTAMGRRFTSGEWAAHVPASVIAQVWRGEARQHPVTALLDNATVLINPLTEEVAYGIGPMLARTRTVDVVDGHVAFLATSLHAAAVTSDAKDILALAPRVEVIAV